MHKSGGGRCIAREMCQVFTFTMSPAVSMAGECGGFVFAPK